MSDQGAIDIGKRPPVDIVIPTSGGQKALDAIVGRLATVRLRLGDTITVVNNSPHAVAPPPAADGVPPVVVVDARSIFSSYYARNAGAQIGRNPWVLFLDDDVDPVHDLLDRFFEPPPASRCAVVAGGITPISPERSGVAGRIGYQQRTLAHEHTLRRPGLEYAQTANALIRREAFTEVLGFMVVESGGDADIMFRLRANGWELEVRPYASVIHHTRATLRGLVRQRLRHAQGAAWLAAEYPGFGSPEPWRRVFMRFPRGAYRALRALLRKDSDAALAYAADGPLRLATRIGFLRPNSPKVNSSRRGPRS